MLQDTLFVKLVSHLIKKKKYLFWSTYFLERDPNDTLIQTSIHDKLQLFSLGSYTSLWEYTTANNTSNLEKQSEEMLLHRIELHQTLLSSIPLSFAVMITKYLSRSGGI